MFVDIWNVADPYSATFMMMESDSYVYIHWPDWDHHQSMTAL